MRTKIHLLIRGLSILLTLLLVSSGLAHAQDATPPATPTEDFVPNRAIAFYPEETGQGTFITVELEAGEKESVDIIVGNSGDIDQVLRIYSAPAISGTNGGFVLTEYGTPPDEATSWMAFEEMEFEFEPGEGVSIPVEISVPADAVPGEYVTGLAAEQSDAFEVPGTEMIVQRVRWTIPVLIIVSGERAPSFELGNGTLEQRENYLIAEIEIENTGNVIVRPEGEVRVLDAEGTVVGTAKVAIESIYVGTETTFIVAWENVIPSESYSLHMELSTEEGKVTVAHEIDSLAAPVEGQTSASVTPLLFSQADLVPLTQDEPPSSLQFNGVITNNKEPVENARVSIVTYQDGVEVDRYPIMQAVTIQTGETPVEARYSLPGGFTEGTYTFEVTIELGSGSTQSVLVTQPIDFEVTVGD